MLVLLMNDPRTLRYPTPEEDASWTAMTAALDELVAAFRGGDPEGVEAASKRTLAIPFDVEALTNAIRVPRDVGDAADALERILRRIPDGWGRWIGVGRGWYPIVTALDRKLADLDRGYRVLQVKEKFGTLRYYWDPDETNPSETVREQGEEFVRAAELLSARTCDECGSAGSLLHRRGWLRTLCGACASSLGYETSE
jgi:hypothetical protein